MFKNKLLKVLALLMVLNILIIPLTNFIPQNQNKYTVYASGELVDIRFFNAMVAMVGVTSAGLLYMSQSFSIPEIDMVSLKDQFQTTLDGDATKKAAWMTAQTEYLSSGVAKTMGAVELSKIGINDIYNQFSNYLKTNYFSISDPISTENNVGFTGQYTMIKTVKTPISPVYFKSACKASTGLPRDFSDYNQSYPDGRYGYVLISSDISNVFDQNSRLMDVYFSKDGVINYLAPSLIISTDYGPQKLGFSININPTLYPAETALLLNYISSLGIFMTGNIADLPLIKGTVNDVNNIVNTDEQYIHIFPTIPWIDTTVPIGTVVTPAISAPYAGAVPIDVPITAPIDPPIDDPIDPPSDTTLLGTVAAILAGLTPIAGFLEHILAGQVSLTDAIEAGLTNVVDGIGDIAETLTGGISSTLTDIKTSISSLFDPPTETLNLDKLKNINSVLFTKFPFSIPFDFTRMLGAFNADPVAPTLEIPFDMSSFGGENSTVKIELSQFDNIAFICRQIGFVGFVFFMLFNTRKLIWK